jgi:hypothetical protein
MATRTTPTYTERRYWLTDGRFLRLNDGEGEYTGADIKDQIAVVYTTGRSRSGSEVHVIDRSRMLCRSGNFRSGAYAVAARVTCDKCLTRYGAIAEHLNNQIPAG